MGVYKKGKNWYIDYYVKGRRKRRKIGPSKKLAEQVLQDVHVKIAKGGYLGVYDEKKILFEEFSQQYLAYSKANKARSTYQHRDQVSIGYLTPFFRGRYIFEITPRMIEKYKAKRLEKVAPATVNRELSCLKHMYTKAIEWGYLKINSAKTVKLPKEPLGRLRYLRPDDVKKGFSAALKRTGIEDFHFHNLKHTFGSHLVMQGVDLKTVQQVMGHKDVKMTMRYSHLSPEYIQETIDRLDNVWTLYGHPRKNRAKRNSRKSL